MTFFEWMEERERIRQKRAAGKPWPWTDDPILREYSFTNVMREYDRVSVWIQRTITNQFHDCPELWILLAIARQVNWPPSLEILMDADGWPTEENGRWPKVEISSLRRALDRYQATGAKVYTGAYIIHADSDPRTSDIWVNKTHYVLGQVIGQLLGKTPPMNSLQAFVKWMTQFESWGGFMAYEVACDLRWAPGWLNSAPDIYTWANPGPGAIRGLNRIGGRPVKGKIPEAQAVREMKALLGEAQTRKWSVKWPREFEMRDIEHSLCEHDKHQRVALNEGRPRAKYKPKEEGI